MQIDCTDASTACTSIGFRPWYSKDGGTYQLLPNTPTSDGISYHGIASALYTGSTAKLTGSLTDAGSQTQRVSTETTVVELPDDSSYVVTVLIKLDPALVSLGDVFFVRLRDQNGNALNAYTSTAQIEVVGHRFAQ